MEKNKNGSQWLEQGYVLFAEEGVEGIQVERLARILQLNKSGFYHYFGDLEGYCLELLALHEKKIDLLIKGIHEVSDFDPGYLELLVASPATVMFQVQLTRNKHGFSFYKASEKEDQRISNALAPLWSDYLGMHNNEALALRYYYFVRDMLYTRVSFENLNYTFLYNLISESRQLLIEIPRFSPVMVSRRVASF
ncbi:MAG TPA: TetR/AcrR family transcriptional regulator [Cyclobacteriaceae bacterium]